MKDLNHKVEMKSYLDVLSLSRIDLIGYDLIVLGPGPGHITDYHELIELIKSIKDQQTFLGICLGHQILGVLAHYDLIQMDEPLHGISLPLKDTARALNIEFSMTGMFYNSWGLVPNCESLGTSVFENSLTTMIDIPFGLGLQFHPESVGSSYRSQILDSALRCVYNKKNEGPIKDNWHIRPENHSASQ